MTNPRPLIVFDVNETLLDIDVLEPLFERIFAQKGRMREWFAQLILYSEALSLAGDYAPFGELGAGVLRMLGQIHAVAITDAQVAELGETIADLPVHREVPAALRRLKDAGFSLVTLTNTAPGAQPDPLDKAGLGPLFDRRFSVDTVRQFKPSPATYRLVTDTMGVAPEDCWLIAAHAWDTIGAQACGWKATLVTRGANASLLLNGVAQPTHVAGDVAEAARKLIASLSPVQH